MANNVIDALTRLASERLLLAVEPLDPGFVPDQKLQDAVEAAVKVPPVGDPGPGLQEHAFAVVDLTADPTKPAYAGWRDTEQRDIASLAKLLPLYGAYRMRDDLGALARALSIDTAARLAGSGRDDYRQLGMSVRNRPRIEQMFTVDGSAQVQFARQGLDDAALAVEHGNSQARFDRTAPCNRPPCKVCRGRDSTLGGDAALDAELRAINFEEQLRLMAGWSDNIAAGVVIQSLGFPYLWRLANASGLFRRSWLALDAEPSGPGGLYLAKDYNCARWRTPPPAAAPPASAGNARSVATLMTMLGQDRLFSDPASHLGLREMLRRGPDFLDGARGEESPIGRGMASAYGEPALTWSADQPEWAPGREFPPDAPLAVSKIGLQDDAVSNALLVRTQRRQRTSGNDITVTAVLVGLCNGTNDKELLAEFGRRMAQRLDALHEVT